MNEEAASVTPRIRNARAVAIWIGAVLAVVVGIFAIASIQAREVADEERAIQFEAEVAAATEIAEESCLDKITELNGGSLENATVTNINGNAYTVKATGVALGGYFRCVLDHDSQVTQAVWEPLNGEPVFFNK